MVKFFLTIASVIIFKSVCCSQLFEFSDVKKLSPSVNSPADEGMPLLSQDGKKMFFTRAFSPDNTGGEFAGQDIWIALRDKNGWSKASNDLRYINNKHNNVVVGLSRDGKTMYFLDGSRSNKMAGIYFSVFSSGNWTRPELIPVPGIDNLDFIGMYVSPDLDVIFISMKAPDTRGEEDLYYSIKDAEGFWMKPRSLGATINTSGFEISPFLSADKKRLYFSSNGRIGEGDADVYFSERIYDSWETWSVPVNAGPVVNSKSFDAYFSIYGDSVAYFASGRDGKSTDIYQVKVSESKTILANGQRYFTQAEWDAVIGKNVSGTLTFPHQSTLLSPPQKELLFYLVNKLQLEKDVHFHLVVREEEQDKFSKERLKKIEEELIKLGIDQNRISTEQIFDREKTQRGVIDVRFFK